MEKHRDELWPIRNKVFYMVGDPTNTVLGIPRYFTTKREAMKATKGLRYWYVEKIKNSNVLESWREPLRI